MDNSPGDSNHYEAVLNDLRAQRDRIDQAIALLESLKGGVGVIHGAGPTAGPTAKTGDELGQGAFLGMSIADAAKKLLSHRRRHMSNAEIYSDLKMGGLVLHSAEPLNTIGSVLNRRFRDVGDVVRVGRGTWGLKDWHPNKNFRGPPKGVDEARSRPSVQDLMNLGLDDDTPPAKPRTTFAEDLDDEIPF